MQKIPLSLAKPGMKLAKPILRDNGLVLVAENSELSASLLERLERMEIGMVCVQGNPVDMGDGVESNPYAARAERLAHLFRKYGNDPWMVTLQGHLKEYFLLKAACSDSSPAGNGKTKPGGAA